MISSAHLSGLVFFLASAAGLVGSFNHAPPGLTFQSDPDQISSLSFEAWSDSQNSRMNHAADNPGWSANRHNDPAPSFDQITRDWNAALGHRVRTASDAFRTVVDTFVGFGFLPTSPYAPVHHQPIDLSKYTIWQVLNWTLHHPPKHSVRSSHHLPLQRLAWAVNLSEPVKEILSDPHADVTLFAPDNKALTPPSKKGPVPPHDIPHDHLPEGDFDSDFGASENPDHALWQAWESLEVQSGCPHMLTAELLGNSGDWDKERKKRVFLHVLELVLKYHVSPGRRTIREIVDSSTLPTALRIAPGDSAPRFRIRARIPHHGPHRGQVALNFFTRIGGHRSRPIITKNGVIHIARHAPLLPPLSPLSELFLFPRPFATLTSALQKVHLDHLLLPHVGNKTLPLASDVSVLETGPVDEPVGDSSLDEVDGRVQAIVSELLAERKAIEKRSFTVFAPTNRAFSSLGFRLNAFLFSPLGAHVLRYILSYHIVPDVIWYSDHVDHVDFKDILTHYEAGSTQDEVKWAGVGSHPHIPPAGHGKVNVTEVALPTLLGSRSNETLKLAVVEYRHGGSGPIARRVLVKPAVPREDVVPVIIPDGTAWGGAIHAIPRVIHPPIPKGHHGHKSLREAFDLWGMA